MRKNGNNLYYIFICLFIISCQQKENSLPSSVQIKKLDYPSASSVEYYNGKLYIMGDDATDLLVLDTSLNVLDSIPIITYAGRRIPKDIKPDIESSAIFFDSLFLFGSGSLPPHRNLGWKYNLKTKNSDSINLTALYSKIKSMSIILQINIEGGCFIKDNLLLANRGNKSYRLNSLIRVNKEFWRTDGFYPYLLIIPLLPITKDSSNFVGVSGLCYVKGSDQLILTASTEDTQSAYEDGAIGKSFLWIINNISDRLSNHDIIPDKIIDLEKIDPRFKSQKIEEAAIIEETKNVMRLVLVADNDDGSSTIFKMSISKK